MSIRKQVCPIQMNLTDKQIEVSIHIGPLSELVTNEVLLIFVQRNASENSCQFASLLDPMCMLARQCNMQPVNWCRKYKKKTRCFSSLT